MAGLEFTALTIWAVSLATACGASTKPPADLTPRCRVTVVVDGGSATESRSYDAAGRLHAASYVLRGDRSRAETRGYDLDGRLVRVELEDGDNKYAPARRATYIEHTYEHGKRVRTNTTEVVWKSLGIGRGFESSPTVQRAIEEIYSYTDDELSQIDVTTTGAENTTAIDTYASGSLIARATSEPGGAVISRASFEYDASGRRTNEAYAECDEQSCETVESVTYGYDIAIDYDELGRPLREILAAGDTESVTRYDYSTGRGARAALDRAERFIQ